MTLPPIEPRSHTLDAIDDARAVLARLRGTLLDEVAALTLTIDRLRADNARLQVERDEAVRALKEVLREG